MQSNAVIIVASRNVVTKCHRGSQALPLHKSRGYNEAITSLAKALAVSGDLARAMFMGRFQDGTPVVVRGTSGTTDLANNFDYDEEPMGMLCPFHAHTESASHRKDR